MTFWKMAYDLGWLSPSMEIAATKLRIVVKTPENPYGEITPAEYKLITNINF